MSAHRATARDRRLMILYGITEAEYNTVLSHQGGACAVCGVRSKKNRLSVDHRHSDGLLRGLLCWSCNKAIAYLRDNPWIADQAADYLRLPPAWGALLGRRFGRTGRATRKWRTKRERREALARAAARLRELGYTVRAG